MSRLEAFGAQVQASLRSPARDPHKVRQAMPRIAVPLNTMCECGWRLDDCHHEQNVDGDQSGHVSRMEHLDEEASAIDVECV